MEGYFIKLSKSSRYDLQHRFSLQTQVWGCNYGYMKIASHENATPEFKKWFEGVKNTRTSLIGYELGRSSSKIGLKVMTDIKCLEPKVMILGKKENEPDEEIEEWKICEPIVIDGLIIEK